MVDKDHSYAMNNAEAAARMEGFDVTSEMLDQCQCVLDVKSQPPMPWCSS